MPSIKPVHWKVLEKIFLKSGFELARHDGTSHRIYKKPGVLRPIVIPTYKEVGSHIIIENLRSAGISRDEYFNLLEQYK